MNPPAGGEESHLIRIYNYLRVTCVDNFDSEFKNAKCYSSQLFQTEFCCLHIPAIV
jgi:hypothetical protein